MKIRWQVWFLLSFVICASFSIYYSMSAGGRGEQIAEENWNWAVKNGHNSLLEYCQAHQITVKEGPVSQTVDIFNDKNPLICADTLDSAKKQYAEDAQLKAKELSTSITFGFIGVWMCLIFLACLITKMIEKKALEAREREGED